MLLRAARGAVGSYRPSALTQRLSATNACRSCLRLAGLQDVRSTRLFHSSPPPEAINQTSNKKQSILDPLDTFPRRHIGPTPETTERMLSVLDPPTKSLDDFVKDVLPADILAEENLELESRLNPDSQLRRDAVFGGNSESDTLEMLQRLRASIQVTKNYIGAGYSGTITPEVIKRNVLENPAWYTSYTPYQAEISQGRLESLLNFQTLVTDLTALPMANASLLDEATAAAEAMTMSVNALPMARLKKSGKTFLVSNLCHPQTMSVLDARAQGFEINLKFVDLMQNDSEAIKAEGDNLIGVLAQYPDTKGGVRDFQRLADAIHERGATFCVATDLLALTVLKAPGEFGADIAFGNAQRFGVPMGFGGPHAAFFACSEKFRRKIPGRLVGVSKDRLGNRALRLALQTREQHIRREKATSNVCTAQALLANMSAFYAIYHGPQGLKTIAERVRGLTRMLQYGLQQVGYEVSPSEGARDDGMPIFDTINVKLSDSQRKTVLDKAAKHSINFRMFEDSTIGISLDEAVSNSHLRNILRCFMNEASEEELTTKMEEFESASQVADDSIPTNLRRTSEYLTHPVFNIHHSETEMLRYIHHLGSKDLSLVHSMIPLGSCTMKLNSTTEMLPLSWPEFSSLHPFVPVSQVKGYMNLIEQLSEDLTKITGMDGVSLQPNSGAQGEFAGLRVIKRFQETQDAGAKRNICLIPVSAHGTNPASATMAGMKVVALKCDNATGNLDVEDLKAKCAKYKNELAAIMVTYPSTFGVFEPQIREVCQIVHEHGGQVYMDGANVTAQIGLCSPGDIGADVCHLNLHKTFCIPHGGGGPGVGPIAVKDHLKPFLPTHPFVDPHSEEVLEQGAVSERSNAISPISAAPWGSASILPISWAYIKMMGARGLTHATKINLLNANYIMSRIKPHYPILYANARGRCAHEFILDARKFKDSCGIEAIDIAKRLQDYGFHAPTMSWPVANTLMIEPTESEGKDELDRFCDALISIRKEISAVEKGDQPKDGNILKMAPHTQRDLLSGEWERPYSREQAAYPLPWLKEKKFWPTVTRVDDAFGDMNLFCTCSPVEDSEDITGAAAPAAT